MQNSVVSVHLYSELKIKDCVIWYVNINNIYLSHNNIQYTSLCDFWHSVKYWYAPSGPFTFQLNVFTHHRWSKTIFIPSRQASFLKLSSSSGSCVFQVHDNENFFFFFFLSKLPFYTDMRLVQVLHWWLVTSL